MHKLHAVENAWPAGEAAAADPFAAQIRVAAVMVAALAGVVVVLMLNKPLYFVLDSASYVPVHTMMEVFAVVVSAMVFGIGWHRFDGRTPVAPVVLCSAFLAVGLLDLLHLLAFPGMPAFMTASNLPKAIHFWLAARAAGAVAMLAAAMLPWTPGPSVRPRVVAMGVALLLTGLTFWIATFRPDDIPPVFVPGYGLTAFKIAAEAALAGAYLLAAAILLHRALAGRTGKAADLFRSACIMALSEICFMLYADATDVFNILGHIYKVIAYLYLYRAIFVEGVREPYLRLKESERSLKLSENRFRNFMEFAPDAILLIDERQNVVVMNARAEQVFGYTRGVLAGMPARTVMPADSDHKLAAAARGGSAISFEGVCRNGDGKLFPVEINLGHLDTDGMPLVIAVVRDISERKHFEMVLLDQMTHDTLTGLPNRRLVNERLPGAIARSRGLDCMLAVMFLDIDHFKRINDNFGHALGDEVLRETVRRLHQALGEQDLLAHQGGDEFIVVQQDLARRQEAESLAERLLTCMREPFHVAGHEIFLSASLGISLFPDNQNTEGLLHTADIAMNSAKQSGRNCYRFHTPEMDQAIRLRLEMEGELRYAVERGELLLHYQPRISLTTGAQVGMEALVRWNHPHKGMISPASFIPVAEDSGLIEQIGLWVIRTACTQVKAWQDLGLPRMCVSVNLSARQFQHTGLARDVQAILDETGLAPASLELEITESTLMNDSASAIKALQSLKQLGVGLSIDDFGTGYSSLSYLKLFPIDVLKVDRSFVKDVIDDPDDAAITRAIIALGHSLDLNVVAEGVETLEQLSFLSACDCDEVQGFYFSKPLPAEEMAALLRERKPMSIPEKSPATNATFSSERRMT